MAQGWHDWRVGAVAKAAITIVNGRGRLFFIYHTDWLAGPLSWLAGRLASHTDDISIGIGKQMNRIVWRESSVHDARMCLWCAHSFGTGPASQDRFDETGLVVVVFDRVEDRSVTVRRVKVPCSSFAIIA